MKIVSIILLFLVISSTSTLAEEIYEWTDNKGVIHITNTPPTNEQAKILNVRPSITTPEEKAYQESQEKALNRLKDHYDDIEFIRSINEKITELDMEILKEGE